MEAAEVRDNELRITSYGVRIDIWVEDSELLEKVMPLLPPGWQPAPDPDSFADAKFVLMREDEGDWRYVVRDGAKSVSRPVDLDVALSFLEWRLRGRVAVWAPNRIFVHAGVVGLNGRALVIPGRSFSGKSTLVAALVRAGATYYSDEFALLDDKGLVHPYPKSITLRPPDGAPTEEVAATDLGSKVAEEPAPVTLIAATTYVPGAEWSPVPVARGEAALALMSHAVPAQERPAETLRAVRRVAECAECLRSDRGEAEPTAAELLSALESS